MNHPFLLDVDAGLSAPNKFLQSKYFYDRIGDELFVKIMHAPEYYLTNAEHEIFKTQAKEFAAKFTFSKPFSMVELGAGDGTKTLELLRHLENNPNFTYKPIDISANALQKLKARLAIDIPGVRVQPLQGEYFKVLDELKSITEPKIILFLGSNLGNMLDENAQEFVNLLAQSMNPKDMLILGVDLIKPAEIVLPAYNDSSGHTRDFNLNLLTRINREFDANFNIENFAHTPEYNANEGIARSFLTSKIDQKVTINALQKTFSFKKNERIFMERSRKYNRKIIDSIFAGTNLKIIKTFTDSNNYFADFLFEKQA